MSFDSGYALVVGVGKYSFMSEYNVPVAARDAQAVAAVLRDETRCAYPPQQVTLLQGEQATRVAFLATLDRLAESLQEKHTLFLYFSGHGVYGTDGEYYLTTGDSRLQGKQVLAGTGLSESELLTHLGRIKARRVLVIINSCHSGQLSPSLGADSESLPAEPPPQKLTEALLSSGEGRITICACRAAQKSWLGPGELSLFSQALVSGLKGEAPNSRGYISAFGLYEYIYDEVLEAAGKLGQLQEPELTILKGVGPFPVALFRAAAQPADFDLAQPAPQRAAVREVSPQKSLRSAQHYNATLTGSGAIAQGPGAKAVGEGGTLIEGDFNGNLSIGDHNRNRYYKDKK